MNPPALRGLLGIVSIVALLAENCDFDQLRRTHEGKDAFRLSSALTDGNHPIDLATEINAVSEVRMLFALILQST
jgi:hypothetical protein